MVSIVLSISIHVLKKMFKIIRGREVEMEKCLVTKSTLTFNKVNKGRRWILVFTECSGISEFTI